MPILTPTASLSSELGQFRTVAQGSGGTSPSLTRDEYNAISMKAFNRVNGTSVGRGPWEHIARWGIGTAIDTADTLWSSPLNPMGERGDVWQFASPEMKTYYEENKGLIEGSSAIVGGIATAVAAEGLIIPRVASALAGSTALAGTGLWRAGRLWNIQSHRAMLQAQRAAAESGEAFGIFSNAAGRNYIYNRTAAGVANATRTIPLEYAMLWNNEAANSGEWQREGFWIGAATVLGGTIGGVVGRSNIRKIANSQEIRDLRHASQSYAGASNDLMSSDYMDDVLKGRIDPNGPQIKESAKLTEFLVGSRAGSPKGYDEAAEHATRQNAMRNEFSKLAVDSYQKVLSTGIAGVATQKVPIKGLAEAENIVQNWGKADPFLFHGLAEGGFVTDGISAVREQRTAHIEMLKKQSQVAEKNSNHKEAARLRRLGRVLEDREENLLVNGSWMDPDSELSKAVVDFNPIKAEAAVKDMKIGVGVKVQLPHRGKITIDAGLTPMDGNNSPIHVEKLSLKDRMFLDGASGALIKKLTRKDAKERFRLTNAGAKSWYSLDLAATILEKGGAIEYATTGMKLAGLEDIKRLSLRLKANAALAEAGDMGRITAEMRFRYNLPAPTALEGIEDSAGDGFRKWLTAAAAEEGTAREFAAGLSDMRVVQGIDLLPPKDSPLPRIDGDMLSFNRNKNGEWMKPMMGYFDPKNQIEKISERGHSIAMAMYKAEKTMKLMNGNNHVSQLARELGVTPEFVQAMDHAGLHADQITGTGGGVGQAVGEALTRRFRFRDNVTLLAATKLQEITERYGLNLFKNLMESVGMQGHITKITSAGHAATRAQLDEYFSLRSGWDVEDMIPLGRQGDHEMFGFRLADTESNRKRLGMTAEDEWDEYATMPNERLGKPIAVNKDAAQAIVSYNKLTDTLLDGDNVLRNAKGLRSVTRRRFYAPPPNTKGAYVAFVMGPDDKMVPGRTIVAQSQDEFNTLKKRTLDELGHNSGYTLRTREQLSSLRNVWDEAEMDWMDPGYSSATAGIGSQKGGLTGAYVKQGAFNEALDWVKRKSVVQSQDTLRSMMEETLTVARAMGAAETAVSANKKTRNIWHEYEAALMGGSKEYAETSIIDKSLRKVEESIDSVLANSSITYPARWVTDLAQRFGMDPTDLNGAKTYAAIAKEMGPYTPFAGVDDFLQSRGVVKPPTVKGMAQKLNTLAASVLLRWFEMPHAAMNALGLIATIPSQLMMGKAPISTFTNIKGETVGITDGVKIIGEAMKDMFSNRGGKDFKYMVEHGYAEQSVMEYHRALGAIHSQAGFFKWAENIDKYISIASDKSESWSRQMAHFVGLRLADYQGLTSMAERHRFAQEIANSVIADYAPINRPELFQSGLGSMFGLFQSYALNHYQKMFRWMENGQYKAMGLQAGMQATMFGLQGTYGLGHLLDLRDSMTATGSEPTAIDLIYESFGPVLGGAIVHGGVSEVTQLAMWTRGDTNFRIPGMSGSLAPLEIGTKVARGFMDGLSAFANSQPGEFPNALMEIVQREMPNRVLRSWMTLLNGMMQTGSVMGAKEIDAYGQVMVDTQNWLDVAARVVGVRSARQQSELEAFYAGKGAMERDSARMEKIRESFRSAVRNAQGDVTQVSPQQYFNDYVKAGGNPRAFKTWVRNLLRDSDSPRSVKSLQNAMSTTRSALETWRFGAYGAWAVE